MVSNPNSKPTFTPTVAVNAAGTVGVIYYDFRNPDGVTTGQPIDYRFTSLTNGSASLGGEACSTDQSFDMLNAPDSNGLFLGNYEAMAASGTAFYPFFVKTNTGNTSNGADVFATSVAP